MSHYTKIHQMYIFNVLRNYMRTEPKSQRCITSMILVHNIIEYFKFKNILELGFCFGQTFSVMLQATAPGSRLTAVDIEFNTELYDKYFKDSIFTKDKTIEFLNIKTDDFVPDGKYDFINSDAGVPYRVNDMVMASKCLAPHGILMIDNWQTSVVDSGIDKFLKLDHGLVPFLIDQQAVYFCRDNLDVSNFLDVVLEERMSTVATLYNKDYKGHFVKSVAPVGISHWDLEDLPELFLTYCQEKNI